MGLYLGSQSIGGGLADAGIAALVPDTGTATGAALAGAFAARQENVINALQEGIVADGTTDDTTAWQALMGNLQPGQRVVLPTGRTSIISAVINVQQAAVGTIFDGRGATLKLAADAPSGTVMLDFDSEGGTVEGLTLDGNGVVSATGVRPEGIRQRITGCHFKDLIAGGVYVPSGSAVSDLLIDDNRFSGDGYGILFDASSAAARVTIADNVFVGGSGTGDAIEVNTPTAGATDITIAGNTIYGYTATSGNQGIGIGLANVVGATVANNIVTGCSNNGIHVEDRSSFVTVSGNHISECEGAGVSLQVGAGTIAPHNNTVTANTIVACATVSGGGGIEFGGGVSLKNTVVSANVIRGCGRSTANCYGIDAGYQSVGLVISDNVISNTVGTAPVSGIRWDTGTEFVVSNNRCYDDQGTATQHYGIRAAGPQTNVLLLGNMLTSNPWGGIDETSLGAVTNYVKANNLPAA